MKVFLSWSGERSKKMAAALKSWLPDVIQAVEPWVSSQDIAKGTRALSEVANELADTDFGIICITPENQTSQWINFEAGALSKQINDSHVVPLILDMEIADLTGPLSQFQATLSRSPEDMKKLIIDINSAQGDSAIPLDRLGRAFEKYWEDLNSTFEKIRAEKADGKVVKSRPTSDMFSELLILLRKQERRLEDIDAVIRGTFANRKPGETSYDAAITVAERKDIVASVRQAFVDQAIQVGKIGVTSKAIDIWLQSDSATKAAKDLAYKIYFSTNRRVRLLSAQAGRFDTALVDTDEPPF